MRRDMDMIRDILLAIEGDEYLPFNASSGEWIKNIKYKDVRHDQEAGWMLCYHLELLLDGKFITAKYQEYGGKEIMNGEDLLINKRNQKISVSPTGLTWRGHEFLDSIRDPEIWRETKDGAKKIGGLSIELIGELAKGLLKKKIEDCTGIKITL